MLENYGLTVEEISILKNLGNMKKRELIIFLNESFFSQEDPLLRSIIDGFLDKLEPLHANKIKKITKNLLRN